ncbi:MAG: DUF5106 domain-containing protein [Bacteroidales bacterium]|nr:DUF5106 domain-containing protein [Bacteroidales bacterium]
MKRTTIFALLMALAAGAEAQGYRLTFNLEGSTDTMLYVGRHYRDRLELVDSARRGKDGSYVFKGKQALPRGVYALVHQGGEKAVGDFMVDDSRQFTLSADAKLTAATVKVTGSAANTAMFAYMAREASARKEVEAIRERKKDPATKAQAEAEEKALVDDILAYEAKARHPKKRQLFFDLVNFFDDIEVPDSVENKAYYYRTHYWDRVFATADSKRPLPMRELMYTPQMFNKMNFFFFNQLYHADSDTINKEIDRLAERIGNDTELLRYVFDHIEPRYFRSTRNIGWDAVWCHLVETYYLKGRCPWVTEGTLHNMRYNYNRIRQSLIGATGQELLMADTNQSPNPEDWVSSYSFPTPYVILWFWDPDCHHCQEQSAELKALYDDMVSRGKKRFEVYAVGYENDVDKWKRYVREHDFRWVNVGGPNVNIDYQEAYNVHGAPTMIILNERHEIIMNKTIPIKNLMGFLDNYEKRQKAENRKN